MAYPKSCSETVSSLKTKLEAKNENSATLGWDVVVNYAVEPINKLLNETFNNKPQIHIKTLNFDVQIFDDRSGDSYAIHYGFGLAAPLIQFNPRGAQGPSCNLYIPIVDGTVKVDGGSDYTVPANVYTLILGNLRLAVAKGHWDSNTKHHDDLFVFHDDTKEGCVVIDLPTSKNFTVDIDYLSNASPIPVIDYHIPDMVRSIKGLFRSDGVYHNIRYEIARVKSAAPDGAYELQPKSFLFDAFLPSDNPKQGDVGVLSLFIQTRDTHRGQGEDLFTAWENQWRVTLKCSPIPLNETASIIFSKEMLYESMIKPAIAAKGFKPERTDQGYSLAVNIGVDKVIHQNKVIDGPASCRRKVGEVHKHLPPCRLEFTEVRGQNVSTASVAHSDGQHDSVGTAKITWKFDYSRTWAYVISTGRYPSSESGRFTVEHDIGERYFKAYLDDRHLSVDCAVSVSDWKVTFTPDNPSRWKEFLGASGRLPEWAKTDVPAPPNFKVTLADVNFFLTTNLLFADDKQVIVVDKKSGLHIPGDFYLVGKVVDK